MNDFDFIIERKYIKLEIAAFFFITNRKKNYQTDASDFKLPVIC